MENKKETLLTSELYYSIVDKTTKEIVELKQAQGETINNISTQKEALRTLKKELKKLKENIKSNKKTLRNEKKNLSKINDAMDVRNTVLMKVNQEFLLSEESYIDLNDYLNLKNPKQKKIN